MRTSEDVLRSLKRYVSVALPAFEVRLSREEGAFERPFARVEQGGPGAYATNTGQFLTDITQPFAVYAYPPRGSSPDQALVAAQQVEDALFVAFRVGVTDTTTSPAIPGRPLRVPLLDYASSPIGDGTQQDLPGVWFPQDYVRVIDMSLQPFADPDDNKLWTVSCQVRLAWRRAGAVIPTGPTLTGIGVEWLAPSVLGTTDPTTTEPITKDPALGPAVGYDVIADVHGSD